MSCGKLTNAVAALGVIVFALLTGLNSASAESGDAEPAGEALYTEIVAPFIKQHCLACHGAKTAKAGCRIAVQTECAAPSPLGHLINNRCLSLLANVRVYC